MRPNETRKHGTHRQTPEPMSNLAKTRILFIFISISVITMGRLIDPQNGIFWGILAALCIIFCLYFLSDYHNARFFPGQKLEGSDPWGLIHTTAQLSQKAKILSPQIFVIPHKSFQTLAFGRSPSSGKIFFTESLLEKLNEQDIRAVLSYHIAGIKKHNTLIYNIASCLSGILSSTIFLQPLAWLILKLCTPPSNYFQTDKLASSYLKEPKDLATTLWKINSYMQAHPSEFNWWLSPLFIVNPLTKNNWFRYLNLQPSVEKRIEKLMGKFPI